MRFVRILLLTSLLFHVSCRQKTALSKAPSIPGSDRNAVVYASGLDITRDDKGLTILTVSTPWPGASRPYRYALVPEELAPVITLNRDSYDAIISIPVKRVVVTSTTHIPALEALGVADRIVGFPETRYVSSARTRQRIEKGEVAEVGTNESLNTEKVLELQPDLVVGFAVGGSNKAYEVLEHSGIPVVYNADWTEESPLGKAEWIKFFAPFFEKETQADSVFSNIETEYKDAKALAAKAKNNPTVLSGALYQDVWYLPGGRSWAAQFLRDAHATYLWKDNQEVGSLALSVESVLDRAAGAEYWIAPSQFSTYKEMEAANRHYTRFQAFRDKRVFTYARTRGETGGLEYYELAPNRPDLVLKDLIHILHPGLLPGHEPYFFKPVQ